MDGDNFYSADEPLNNEPVDLGSWDGLLCSTQEEEEDDEEEIQDKYNTIQEQWFENLMTKTNDQAAGEQAGCSGANIGNNDDNLMTDSSEDSEGNNGEQMIDFTQFNKPTPEHLLRLNTTYEHALKYLLQRVNSLSENHMERRRIKELKNKSSAEYTIGLDGKRINMNVYRYRFRDPRGIGPGEDVNSDLRIRNELLGSDYDPWIMPPYRVTPKHQAALKRAVMSNAAKKYREPLMSQLEHWEDKMEKLRNDKKVTKQDEQYIKAEKKIEEILHKMNNPPEDLIGPRSQEHDWTAIANIDMGGTHTSNNMRLFWQNRLHPSINRNTKFTAEENTKLLELVEKYPRDWKKIASELPGRTAMDCFRAHLKTKGKDGKTTWTKEDDRLFVSLVHKYAAGCSIPYSVIACHMPHMTASQLCHRWTKSLNPAICRERWTPQEDFALIKAYVRWPGQWARIRDSNLLPGRSDAQIRERYKNSLNLESRGPFTEEEDIKLTQLVEKKGMNWATIAKHMKGRTDSQVAKRYKLIVDHRENNKPINYNWTKETYKWTGETLQELVSKIMEKRQTDTRSGDDADTPSSSQQDAIDATASTHEANNNEIEVTSDVGSIEGSKNQKKKKEKKKNDDDVVIQEPLLKKPIDGRHLKTSNDILKAYHELVTGDAKKKKTTQKRAKIYTKEFLVNREKVLKFIKMKMRPVKQMAGQPGHPANMYRDTICAKWTRYAGKDHFSALVGGLNLDTAGAFAVIKRQRMMEDFKDKNPEATEEEIEDFKATLPSLQKYINESRKKNLDFEQQFEPQRPNVGVIYGWRKLLENREALKRAAVVDVDENTNPKNPSTSQSTPLSTAPHFGTSMADASLLEQIKMDGKYRLFEARFRALFTWPETLRNTIPQQMTTPPPSSPRRKKKKKNDGSSNGDSLLNSASSHEIIVPSAEESGPSAPKRKKTR